MSPQIVVLSGKLKGKILTFSKRLSIGRSQANDLSLPDEAASRDHAVIHGEESGFVLRDLGSSNGTFINGIKIQERVLHSGDEIRIGGSLLTFYAEELNKKETRIVGAEESHFYVESSLQEKEVDIFASSTLSRAGDAKEHLKSLFRIASRITSILDLKRLLEETLQEVSRVVHMDRGAVLLKDPSTGDVDFEGGVFRGGEGKPLSLSRTIVGRVLQNRETLLISHIDKDSVLGKRESILRQGIQSIICVPLVSESSTEGILYIDSLASEHSYSQPDLEFLTEIGRGAGAAIKNARIYLNSRDEVRTLKESLTERHRMVGKSGPFLEVMKLIEQVGPADSTVLLLGETGTGKELLARAIHETSRRREKPFIAINCAALPETLLESELFGYERGAFTGAVARKKGRLELAHGGTVFLDEIGEMPVSLQAKLLRVLDEKAFCRLGSGIPIKVDFRIIVATNRDLEKAVQEKAFREDLFFRLRVFTIRIPTLKERKEDIELLANHFARIKSEEQGKARARFTPRAVQALKNYYWPGNVRELENVVERAVVLCESGIIDQVHLPREISYTPEKGEKILNLKEAERIAIEEAMRFTKGKKGEAAKLLGIAWPTLNRKLKEHGLE